MIVVLKKTIQRKRANGKTRVTQVSKPQAHPTDPMTIARAGSVTFSAALAAWLQDVEDVFGLWRAARNMRQVLSGRELG